MENGMYEYKGYVCNSNAAKPFLDSLNKYLADSLELFLKQELDEEICASAVKARDKMNGWQRILEVLNQMDRNLQRKYENAYEKIKNDCNEINKRQTIVVVTKGAEPRGSNALKNLELYVEEYLVNSSVYSRVERGREAKFKCDVEIIPSNYSGSTSYKLTAKIINVKTGKVVPNRQANTDSYLKTPEEHKKASLELVNKLLKRCGTMGVGDNYDGRCQNGLREGYGKYSYLAGQIYEGEWKDDMFNGQGKFIIPNIFVYDGEWKEGFNDGKGKITATNGYVYDGYFKKGFYDGWGKLTLPNGYVYEGDFKKGMYNGKGIGKNPNGDYHNGVWKDNVFVEGKGRATFPNGYVYEGDLKNDMPNGIGKAKYPNGEIYEGGWKDDKFDGQGKHLGTNGTYREGIFRAGVLWEGKAKITLQNGIVYEGNVKNGKANGNGKITLPDGSFYEGEFKNDEIDGQGRLIGTSGSFFEGVFRGSFSGSAFSIAIMKGKGKLIFPNGNVYEGEFENDIMNGRGKMTTADGSVAYDGLWENGNPVGSSSTYNSQQTNSQPSTPTQPYVPPPSSQTYTETPPPTPTPPYVPYSSTSTSSSIDDTSLLYYILGSIALVGSGVLFYYGNKQFNDKRDAYNSLNSGIQEEYDKAWKEAKDAKNKRDNLYNIGTISGGAGGMFLVAGIGGEHYDYEVKTRFGLRFALPIMNVDFDDDNGDDYGIAIQMLSFVLSIPLSDRIALEPEIDFLNYRFFWNDWSKYEEYAISVPLTVRYVTTPPPHWGLYVEGGVQLDFAVSTNFTEYEGEKVDESVDERTVFGFGLVFGGGVQFNVGDIVTLLGYRYINSVTNFLDFDGDGYGKLSQHQICLSLLF